MKTLKSMSTFLMIIAGSYLLILSLMYLFQNKLLFMPFSGFVQTPDNLGLYAEDIWIETDDGVTLHSWYFPNDETDWVVVLSHGNAGNISGRISIAETLLKSGAAVLMYDYRGFGKSNGSPTEEGLYKDIEAVIQMLKSDLNYSERQIVMYGRSLGGAVGAYAATRYNLGGLVIDSSFKNLEAMVGDVYPFVPAWLAKYQFSTDEYLSRLDGMPIMIMHSPDDEIVRYHHGEYLYNVINGPKKFVELRGGHNDNFFASKDIIIESWKEYLDKANDVLAMRFDDESEME